MLVFFLYAVATPRAQIFLVDLPSRLPYHWTRGNPPPSPTMRMPSKPRFSMYVAAISFGMKKHLQLVRTKLNSFMCSNALVFHVPVHITHMIQNACKVPLEVIAGRLGDYCEREGTLPEEQGGIRPQRSTGGMIFVVRRLQESARRGIPRCTCDLPTSTKPTIP